MAHPINELSENREMYLVRLAGLLEDGQASLVPLHLLADELAIMPASVNEMVRKLDEEGLVRYVPYKGVELLAEGARVAQSVLRRHRLWEVFFVEKLKLDPDEADELACRLEHITPLDVAERLSEYLGRPNRSPLGREIPPSDAVEQPRPGMRLNEASVDEALEVVRLACTGQDRSFLHEQGIQQGARVRLEGVGRHKELLLESEKGLVCVSAELGATIFVERVPEAEATR